MKIQLTYDRPAQISADLLVVILDSEIAFSDLSGSPLDETVRRISRDYQDKRLKADYFTSIDSRSSVAGESTRVITKVYLGKGILSRTSSHVAVVK